MRTIILDNVEERIEYDDALDETFHYRKDYLYHTPAPIPGLYSMVLTYSHHGKAPIPSVPSPDTVSDCKGAACSIPQNLPEQSQGRGLHSPLSKDHK